MKLLLPVIGMSLFLTGCSIAWSFQDISETQGCKEWIGKEIKTKKEMFIIHNWQKGDNFIRIPRKELYPTIDEYRRLGKTSENITDDTRIHGIIEPNEILIIKSVGYTNHPTLGKILHMLVTDKNNGNPYYLEYDLFSFKDNTIFINNEYLEIVTDQSKPAEEPKQPAVEPQK